MKPSERAQSDVLSFRNVATIAIMSSLVFLYFYTQPPAATSAKNSALVTGLSEGNTAPDFHAKTTNGQVVGLSDYRGSKAVVLFFWQSSCLACKHEMVILEELYQDYKDSLVVLAVNYGEKSPKAQAFVREAGATYPILLDEDYYVSRAYLVNETPAIFFINKNGTIAKTARTDLSDLETREEVASLTSAKQP
ncbi:MAG TPA: TlpA disulfide reductase family protein [Candidatus Norongarragalinales archaeon]|nr:TlpA disulfide reductase family protein [Candidatus Norongarragalinales archaeon]